VYICEELGIGQEKKHARGLKEKDKEGRMHSARRLILQKHKMFESIQGNQNAGRGQKSDASTNKIRKRMEHKSRLLGKE